MEDPIFKVLSDLGPDLLFNRMKGTEELGRLFEYQLDLLSPKIDIDPARLLGKNMAVQIMLSDGSERYLTGIVTNFSEGGTEANQYAYHATLRPSLWMLTRNANCRIFQNKSIKEIIDDVFADYPDVKYSNNASGHYPSLDYCVQYRETDFDFLSRLMEQEGIYYYFEHDLHGHKLILVDAPAAHETTPGFETLRYRRDEIRVENGADVITDWRSSMGIVSSDYVTQDYDFTKPSVPLSAVHGAPETPDNLKAKVFDYPGGYVDPADGDRYARIRLEEIQATSGYAQGRGNVRSLATGYMFTLCDYPRSVQNKEYLVVKSLYTLQAAGFGDGRGRAADFKVDFTVIDSKVQYRSPSITRKPFMQGPQTARVVGQDGEDTVAKGGDDIYTDEFGRVKVRFFWEHDAKGDERNSCWIRVSHPWAGKNWGMIAIPRVNQEVIVDFLEGNPDRPIITGRVYNAEQKVPYSLEEGKSHKTQTGIKSRSTIDGTPNNFNEIRFEDLKGKEEFVMHAERNMSTSVEVDDSTSVGHDQTISIQNNQMEFVKNQQTLTVGGNRYIDVKEDENKTIEGSRTLYVKAKQMTNVDMNVETAYKMDEAHSVDGKQVISVKGLRDLYLSDDLHYNVNGQRRTIIGANDTLEVAKSQKLSIGSKQNIFVGDDQTIAVGGHMSHMANKISMTSAGDTEIIAAGEIRHTSVGSTFTMMGTNTSNFFGGSAETKLGTVQNLCAAGVVNTMIGLSADNFLGFKTETFVGLKVSASLAGTLSKSAGFDFTFSSIKCYTSPAPGTPPEVPPLSVIIAIKAMILAAVGAVAASAVSAAGNIRAFIEQMEGAKAQLAAAADSADQNGLHGLAERLRSLKNSDPVFLPDAVLHVGHVGESPLEDGENPVPDSAL